MTSFRPSATALAGALLFSIAAAFSAPANAQEVDIFYDQYGRRILMDPYTGEVLRIEPPRQLGARRVYRDRYPEEYPYPGEEDYTYGIPEEYEPLPEEPRDGYRILPAPDQPYPGDEPPVVRYPDAPPPPAEHSYPPVERAPLTEPRQAALAPSLARPEPNRYETTASRNAIAAMQVLLDRKGASPGVIDGRMGDNVAKAMEAYRTLTGRTIDPADTVAIEVLLEETGGPATTTYEITAADIMGPYILSVPVDYSEKAALPHMSYTSPVEMLAERFHMDENYLKILNPDADFHAPGTIITVANIKRTAKPQVERIVADKASKQVRAYDATGKLVAAYPATIGSAQTPSPSGLHKVSRIAFDPNYTYNPKLNFKQGNNDRVLTIPPGPNGPVGSIWIALDRPTYGIHGTPDPSKIGKTASHGCVRLTNWDARELAKLVKPDVTVEFLDDSPLALQD